MAITLITFRADLDSVTGGYLPPPDAGGGRSNSR